MKSVSPFGVFSDACLTVCRLQKMVWVDCAPPGLVKQTGNFSNPFICIVSHVDMPEYTDLVLLDIRDFCTESY